MGRVQNPQDNIERRPFLYQPCGQAVTQRMGIGLLDPATSGTRFETQFKTLGIGPNIWILGISWESTTVWTQISFFDHQGLVISNQGL